MKIQQSRWSPESKSWYPTFEDCQKTQLVILFGATSMIESRTGLDNLRKHFPNAVLFGCTTAGEILDTTVSDQSLIATSVAFTATTVKTLHTKLRDMEDSYGAGDRLGRSLDKNDLRHVFILSCGLNVNGTDLVKGLNLHLPDMVTITGGLSGDDSRFQVTYVLGPEGEPLSNGVALLALYGQKLRIGYASLGGWDVFGREMIVTRSRNNVLYELDGASALELYKQALGDHAKNLPAAGLLYPISLRTDERENAVVRTILGINESDQSIIFAGSMPQGSAAHFMKANFDRVIEGASGAAKICRMTAGSNPELAILISCVGRKLILKERTREEVEGVRKILGDQARLTGFYSYGEISPFAPGAKCELHNQTMTITTFSEK